MTLFAINKALIALNFEPLKTIAVKALIGPDLRESLSQLINDSSFSYDKFEPIFATYYAQNNTQKRGCIHMLSGIKQLVQHNKNLFILTNKPSYQAIQICKRLSISQYMLEIIGPDTYEPKPSPKAINTIIEN